MATMRPARRCGIAHALDLVGERWALMVVRELLLGPKRFTDLGGRALPPPAPTCSRSACATWTSAGIVRRRLPPPRRRVGLRAHRLGPRAEPIVLSLGGRCARRPWAIQPPARPSSSPCGTFFDAEAAGDIDVCECAWGSTFAVQISAIDERSTIVAATMDNVTTTLSVALMSEGATSPRHCRRRPQIEGCRRDPLLELLRPPGASPELNKAVRGGARDLRFAAGARACGVVKALAVVASLAALAVGRGATAAPGTPRPARSSSAQVVHQNGTDCEVFSARYARGSVKLASAAY